MASLLIRQKENEGVLGDPSISVFLCVSHTVSFSYLGVVEDLACSLQPWIWALLHEGIILHYTVTLQMPHLPLHWRSRPPRNLGENIHSSTTYEQKDPNHDYQCLRHAVGNLEKDHYK